MVFEPAFCDQSRNTLPDRRALVIVAVTSLGCSPWSSSATSLASALDSSEGSRFGRSAYRCRPLLPLVTGLAVEVALGELVAHQQRHLAALVQAGRLAGVEVDDQPVGVARLPVAADGPLVDVQLERGQVDQPGQRGEVVDDREDQRVAARLDAREPVVGTFAVRTQDGVPAGVFFSKKLDSCDAVRPPDPGHAAVRAGAAAAPARPGRSS